MAEQILRLPGAYNRGQDQASEQSMDVSSDNLLNVGIERVPNAIVSEIPAVEVEVHGQPVFDINRMVPMSSLVHPGSNTNQGQQREIIPTDITNAAHDQDKIAIRNFSQPVLQVPCLDTNVQLLATTVTQINRFEDVLHSNKPGSSSGISNPSTSVHQSKQQSIQCMEQPSVQNTAHSVRKDIGDKMPTKNIPTIEEEGLELNQDHSMTGTQYHIPHKSEPENIHTSSEATNSTTPQNYLWCEDCGRANEGECKTHGCLTPIVDSIVLSYARSSLPSVLCIKHDCAGSGVFAKRYIKSRSQFGPLIAPMCAPGTDDKEGKQPYFYLKGYDNATNKLWQFSLGSEDVCNWMMFVRPAKTFQDQNMVAYMYNRKIFFTTIKPVDYGKELRVWYASDYAAMIGMSMLAEIEVDIIHPKETEKGDVLTVKSNQHNTVEDIETAEMDSEKEDSSGEKEEQSDEDNVNMFNESCDTNFKDKESILSPSCKSRKLSNKKDQGTGATKRKGSPRKLTLDDDWNPKSKGIEKNIKVKVNANSRTIKRLPSSKEKKATRNRKTKVKEEGKPRKKYNRTPRFACAYCPETFRCQDPYRVHEASHTGKSAYVCDVEGCGKGFETKFTYSRHMLCHEKPNNKKCPYCDKSFNRADHLKTHLTTHSQHRFSYLCDKCGKSYLHKKTYDYHMALHEAKEGMSLDCLICGSKFTDKDDLIKHTLAHSRYRSLIDVPKSIPCPVCNRMFFTKKDVRRHMVVHTKEKSFLCEWCSQTFGRKDHLQRHYKSNHSKEALEKKVENPELPFSCEECHQKFAKKKLLTNHKKFCPEQTYQPPVPRVEENPLQVAANEITEASVTSSSYNLYTLSTPVHPTNPATVKALERLMNTGTAVTQQAILNQPTVLDSSSPVTFINAPNMAVSVVQQVREQCSEQMQHEKDRVIFQTNEIPRQRQVPWTLVVEERDDHSYSTNPTWTPKVPNYRPSQVSSAAEVETARLLQSAQSSQNQFSTQCSNATTMAVAWDTMTDYFQPCSNITEVVTTPSLPLVRQPQQHHDSPNVTQRGLIQQQQQQQQPHQ